MIEERKEELKNMTQEELVELLIKYEFNSARGIMTEELLDDF